MYGQTFSLFDIPRVAFLAFLEIILSADNAIVLSIISKSLPKERRKKALYIGFLSACLFRAIGIFFIAYLLDYFWLQLLGGLYLLYLAARYFLKKRNGQILNPSASPALWKTILAIELFDLAFAVDSIVAAVAFLDTTSQKALFHPKLWIAYAGGMIGVFSIRYAAHLFSSLIDRFPRLEPSAYAMIGWIGCKLSLTSLNLTFPYFLALFWIGLPCILFIGFTKNKSSNV